MKALFVIGSSPLSSNYSGAASRYKQNFLELQKFFNEVHVLRMGRPEDLKKVIEFETKNKNERVTKELACSWQDISFNEYVHKSKIMHFFQSLSSPIDYEFPYAHQITFSIQECIQKIQPNLIWAEHLEPAAGMYWVSTSTKWIFSHIDLIHRVQKIRQKKNGLHQQWDLLTCRRAEKKILQSAPLTLTGSYTEVARIMELGGKNIHVIPISYETIPPPPASARIGNPVRIVHFGSLETTANRVGLEAYLKRSHKQVVQACKQNGVDISLWIIGDASKIKEPLSALLKEANATLAGFVPDLQTVLRPFDIAILPYEYDTGYRTKLPLLLGFAQVVVSTRASVAGTLLPGLEEACILCERLSDFPNAFSKLTSQASKMENIGRSAHNFFTQHFTRQAFEAKYKKLFEIANLTP